MSKKIVDCDWFSYQFGRGFGAGLKRCKIRTYLSESIRNLFSRTRCRGIDIIIYFVLDFICGCKCLLYDYTVA